MHLCLDLCVSSVCNHSRCSWHAQGGRGGIDAEGCEERGGKEQRERGEADRYHSSRVGVIPTSSSSATNTGNDGEMLVM